MSVLPLIALPGTSPRERGEERRPLGALWLCTVIIGEIIDDSAPLPVYGERMAAAR